MSYCTRLLFVLLLFVKQEVDLAIIVRKFVYQKDMSEYCRRRVMPSVFLGRQVVDAYSKILHFSRLELPYSCFVNVRTESGSNIILVIQLMSGNSLIESCRESKNQLLVYEIGETFGGYWGALPNNMINVKANTEENQHYTLKTTQPETTTTTTERTTIPSTMMMKGLVESSETTKRQNEFVVEIPIVNVSGVLVPGVQQESTSFDEDETFDRMIDVKPKPDMNYKTNVLPLVQFAISDDVIAQRTNEEDLVVAPRYEFNLNADIFTPDPRLSFPLLRLSTKKKELGKYKYNYNSKLDFKKNKKLFAEKQALFHRTSYAPEEQVTFGPKSSDLLPRPDFIESTSTEETSAKSNPYEIVDAILKNLSKTRDEDPKIKVKIDKDVQDLLQGLAKIGYNESVYLMSNDSWHGRRPSSPARRTFTARRSSNKYRTDSITWRQPSASYGYRTNYFEDEEDVSSEGGSSQHANESPNSMQATDNNDTVIIDALKTGPLLPPDLDIDRVLLNVTQQNNEMEKNPIIVEPETFTQRNNEMEKSPIIVNPDTLASERSGTTTTSASPETVIPMTLVDHESWENMVQAASLMAVVLNQSITSSVGDEHQALNVTLLPPRLRRKKRYIHAIPIELAKPHHIPVVKDEHSTTHRADKISDLQEFQQLIELQDDEVHDRVAQRFMGEYLGPAMFNICDFDEAAAGHTFLFNSSRLVLAINNFTMERMTVVMTPARTLLTTEARCAAENLECQVSGARVCIDSLCACDGVPNCGKYDIYDEDHLKCGGSARFQHNVYLAAITFLAVLLTMLYTVHYWLKRCVPKVSDAFFIYTDAAENFLYLDPIMRSPHDTEDPKDFYRGTAIQDYNMECTDMRMQTKKAVGSFINRWSKRLRCKRQKKHPHILGDQIIESEYNVINPGERRFFSFAEVELGQMGTTSTDDAAVQTGPSLDNVMNEPFIKEQMIKVDSDSEDIVAHYEGKPREIDRRSFINIATPMARETSDELSILNFFKRARSVSKIAEIQGMYPLSNTEEKEIQCLEFDHSMAHAQLSDSLTAITGETSNKKNEVLKKKLRFEEEMTTIHVSDDEILEEDPGGATDQRRRRSAFYGSSRNHNLDESNSNGNVDEPSTSTGNREFKSYFWGGKSRSKKSKKKNQQFNLR